MRLLAFPKAKITVQRVKISDRAEDKGHHDKAADGNPERGLCKLF
jgi:hypothetical protein